MENKDVILDEFKTRHLGDRATKEPCLKIFEATKDWGEGTEKYFCGLDKGHSGGHAWRGDLPGGRVNFPAWDAKNMRPSSKMPNCPRCYEDELSMISENYIYCNYCGFKIYDFAA